jgi:RimJ/RimL family protein N-acetyltransferase
MMIGTSCSELGLARAVHLLVPENVTVRPARSQDSDIIQAYIRNLSPASRRNRFLGSLNEVSANELHGMTHNDHGTYPSLIAENNVDGACTMIGEARYAVAADGLNCEFAVSVAEAWRRKRLATLLVGIVASRAKALGLLYLVGDVLRSNEAMIALARKIGFTVTAPVTDATLAKITKDLSLLDATQPWNELASQDLQPELISIRAMLRSWVRSPLASTPSATIAAFTIGSDKSSEIVSSP